MERIVADKKESIEWKLRSLIEYYEQELEFLRRDNAELEKKLKSLREKALALASKLA